MGYPVLKIGDTVCNQAWKGGKVGTIGFKLKR
jgi:hypothetical protein